MLKFSVIAVIFMVFSASIYSQSVDGDSNSADKVDFAELKTKEGTLLRDCRVKRVNADGLVVEHSKGVSHLSFFDLPSEIQERYDFDPVAALEEYRTRIAAERDRRKGMVLEAERQKAEAIRIAARDERYEIAKAEWIPAEGKIIQKQDDGFFIQAKSIVMVPTKVISKLGFENEGPPKRELYRFGPGLVYLRVEKGDVISGKTWQGYIDPGTVQTTRFPRTGATDIPVHRAITLRD